MYDRHPLMKIDSWYIYDVLEENDRNAPLPHAIITFEGVFPASVYGHYFTIYELRAIVQFLLIRSLDNNVRLYPGYRTHPVSKLFLLPFFTTD